MGMRARGANAVAALAFETLYGKAPGSGFVGFPFVSDSLGEEQGLDPSDLLGLGRKPQAPSDGPINNVGDIVVPVDLRYFGLWLKLLLGPPTTTQGVAASGSVTFSDQPAANATLTVNGTAFTFKASPAGPTDIKIGATLAETIRNAVWALNASADANVKVASYATDADATSITVKHDTIGTGGNSFTLARSTSPVSSATVSGATLAGGSTSGPYNHVFIGGLNTALPSLSIEFGQPEVPSYAMNSGIKGNTLNIPLQRSGNLSATLGLIAQREALAGATQAGTPTTMVVERFAQAGGFFSDRGVILGDVVSGAMAMSNNLEAIENIRPDGYIDGADEGMLSVTPQIVARFRDTVLLDLAKAKTAIDLSIGWKVAAGKSLDFRMPAVRLPVPKRSRSGPGGIQLTYAGQGQTDSILGEALIATLVNDVPSYA